MKARLFSYRKMRLKSGFLGYIFHIVKFLGDFNGVLSIFFGESY